MVWGARVQIFTFPTRVGVPHPAFTLLGFRVSTPHPLSRGLELHMCYPSRSPGSLVRMPSRLKPASVLTENLRELRYQPKSDGIPSETEDQPQKVDGIPSRTERPAPKLTKTDGNRQKLRTSPVVENPLAVPVASVLAIP